MSHYLKSCLRLVDLSTVSAVILLINFDLLEVYNQSRPKTAKDPILK